LTSQTYHAEVSIDNELQVPVSSYGNLGEKNTLTFVNGVWSRTQSSFDDSSKEIQLRKLKDLPVIEQKAVLRAYMSDIASSDDFFITLNIMLSQETYLLEISDHIQVEDVIVIQHVITEGAQHVVPQLIVKVGLASQVTIVENWYGSSSNVLNFVNPLTHISLEAEARLTYYTLHTESPSFYQVNNLYCNQKDHSTFMHHTFSFGSTMLRMNLTTQIKGIHATANLYGLYSLCKKEKMDHRIQVIHSCPHSLSKQHYKGMLGGQSIGVFNGKIYLTPEAQKTNAYQTNNAIILSNEAHHYVKPQLEIYADDVKCSHGATSGQLDQEQLFYLQTRGIEVSLAKRLLLEAFGKEMINLVSVTKLQVYLLEQLAKKLLLL
jgi:Fe-S cluster assembly protein SufD